MPTDRARRNEVHPCPATSAKRFNTLNNGCLHTTTMGTQWAFHGHEPPKTQGSGHCRDADLVFLGADDEIRTRDPHLGEVVVTVRTVRLLLRSTPQSLKPSGKSVCSVPFVNRSTITHALCARQLALRTTAWPLRIILAVNRFSVSHDGGGWRDSRRPMRECCAIVRPALFGRGGDPGSLQSATLLR